MPLDGLLGVRFADTHQSLGAYENPLDTSGSSIAGQFVHVSYNTAGWRAPPMFSSRLHITDSLHARFSATKSITRPNSADLNPAVALLHSGPTSQVGTGTGGNPNMKPISWIF